MLAILNAEDDEARRCQDHHCAVKAAPLEEYDRSQASHGRRAPSEEEYKRRSSTWVWGMATVDCTLNYASARSSSAFPVKPVRSIARCQPR
jgi:hypothetical protein